MNYIGTITPFLLQFVFEIHIITLKVIMSNRCEQQFNFRIAVLFIRFTKFLLIYVIELVVSLVFIIMFVCKKVKSNRLRKVQEWSSVDTSVTTMVITNIISTISHFVIVLIDFFVFNDIVSIWGTEMSVLRQLLAQNEFYKFTWWELYMASLTTNNFISELAPLPLQLC